MRDLKQRKQKLNMIEKMLISLYRLFFITMMLVMARLDLIAQSESKPNIIYIYTDQQSARMMSCAGNKFLETPAMDYIADNGVRFTKAYTTNPVCVPARISLMTGRFPTYFKDREGNKVLENSGGMGIDQLPAEVEKTHLGYWLKNAGYELVFGGKQHLPEPLSPQNLGFKIISTDERKGLAIASADYISGAHEKPYFMVVSLINPHDICYMAIRDFATEKVEKMLDTKQSELSALDKAIEKPQGVTEEEFYKHYAPPLPPNFEPQIDEPPVIQSFLDIHKHRWNARSNYSDKDWRLHRWAYCRLTEQVDEEVEIILSALRESGKEENTIVIFSSDHGEMDGAHQIEQKNMLYEESANIPLLIMWKGKITPGQVDSTHLISNGLDILPTITDYAGNKGVADPRGLSLRQLLENKEIKWRESLGVESELGQMVVYENGLKYIRYFGDEPVENLLDLAKDPYETTHFTKSPEYSKSLKKLKKEFRKWWFQD